MVCGPNGAGKSTYTSGARKEGMTNIPFIDPDQIAKERQCSPLEAGKIASSEIKRHLQEGSSFGRESTLSSKFDLQLIQIAKEQNFTVSLVFVGINSANHSMERVKDRHANGGHFVPDEDVKRRYDRCMENLPEAIRQVDQALIIDNSEKNYQRVAKFEKGILIEHTYTPQWFLRPLEALKTQEVKQQKTQIQVLQAIKNKQRERDQGR